MSAGYYKTFVDWALSQQGCPYIWGGKDKLVFVNGQLKPHAFTDLNDMTKPISVFDCSGLVTCALYVASLMRIDLRGSHSAKTILETFPECSADFGDGCLLLYDGHVDVCLGRGRVLGAHRGDSSCTNLQRATERNARVEAHPITRRSNTLLGYRRIPVDKAELKKL